MIADFEYHLRETNRRFAEKHISTDQDWLSGCVEWFLSETPQISKEDLYKNAYEQWKLSDLADSAVKCLPESVQTNVNAFDLNGNYALQIQYLIDIAESAYEQYRSLHGKKLDEAEEGPEQSNRNVSKKKRMLKLELTDGYATVIAMEHSPISSLSSKLCPGTKILLKGPIRCINKVLFLKPENVQILGGEVEKIAIENAYENVLLKALGRPTTSTPKLDYKETTASYQITQPTPNLPSMPVISHRPQPTRNIIHDDDDDLFSNLDIDSLNQNTATHHSTDANQFLDDDDDIFFEANIPDTAVNERVDRNQKSNQNIFDDDDEDLAEIERKIEQDIENEQRRHAASVNQQETAKKSVATEYFDPDLDAIFPSEYSIDDDFETKSSDILDRNYEFKIAGCPLVTILQLHSIDENDKSERSFVVKCEIFKTVEQIRIVDKQYRLIVLIKDSTGLQLERPQQRQQMESILKKLGDTLTEFDGFMKIDYSRRNEIPEVTGIIGSKAKFEEMLKNKLRK
ncbi:RecQ-mediated genome instability protein 1, partial [Pseudolycoriella hygida]